MCSLRLAIHLHSNDANFKALFQVLDMPDEPRLLEAAWALLVRVPVNKVIEERIQTLGGALRVVKPPGAPTDSATDDADADGDAKVAEDEAGPEQPNNDADAVAPFNDGKETGGDEGEEQAEEPAAVEVQLEAVAGVDVDWESILSSTSVMRLLYNLRIIDTLLVTPAQEGTTSVRLRKHTHTHK